jgi:hypothetical protein
MSDPSNPPRTRRPALWGALVLLGLAIAYGTVWFANASLLRKGVESWIADRQREGYTIQTAPPALVGFPTRLAVRLTDATITTPAAKGSWRWHAGKIDVVASPLSISHMSLDLSGTHEVTGGWIPVDQPLRLGAEHAQLALTIGNDGRVSNARFETASAKMSWPQADQNLVQAGAIVADVTLVGANSATPAVTSRLALSIDELSLPSLPHPLTSTVHKATVTAEVDGPVTSGPLPQVLEAWRSAGGAFDVKDFSLDWPPLFVAGNGTLALDEHLQPEGAFSTRIGGYSEAIDALVAQNDLDARGGALAKGVLGLLSQNSANGGREIQVSVTVQDQKLSIGPLQLLTLPAVSWPAATVP